MQAPVTSTNWSGSEHCYDRNLVIAEATVLSGRVNAMTYGIKICSAFFLAVAADRLGRRFAMIVGCIGLCLSFAIMALTSVVTFDTTLGSEQPAATITTAMVYLASGILGLTNPVLSGWTPFVTAMVADLSLPADRSQAMTSYATVRTMASICAFGFGYGVLQMHITEYDLVWGCFAGVAAVVMLLFVFVVRETLQVDEEMLDDATTDNDNDNDSDMQHSGTSMDGPKGHDVTSKVRAMRVYVHGWLSAHYIHIVRDQDNKAVVLPSTVTLSVGRKTTIVASVKVWTTYQYPCIVTRGVVATIPCQPVPVFH